jgi:hypothetical protein
VERRERAGQGAKGGARPARMLLIIDHCLCSKCFSSETLFGQQPNTGPGALRPPRVCAARGESERPNATVLLGSATSSPAGPRGDRDRSDSAVPGSPLCRGCAPLLPGRRGPVGQKEANEAATLAPTNMACPADGCCVSQIKRKPFAGVTQASPSTSLSGLSGPRVQQWRGPVRVPALSAPGWKRQRPITAGRFGLFFAFFPPLLSALLCPRGG